MQSAVNTLNQAAKEEAAYPSSLPLSPSLSFARTLYLSLFPLSLSLSLSTLPLICFISVCLYLSPHFFFNLLSCFSPFATSIWKYSMQTLPSLLTALTLNSTERVFYLFFTMLPTAHLYQPRLSSHLTLAGHKSQTKPAWGSQGVPKVRWVTWHSGWPLAAWQGCLPNEISRVMPTLCLFLLPPSPAHPGALYLASSRTGCASIRRSRAGQDPQAHCPPMSLPPDPVYLNGPARYVVSPFCCCIVFVSCHGFVSNSLIISLSHPVSVAERLSLILYLSPSVCLRPSYSALSSLFIKHTGKKKKKVPLMAGLNNTGQWSNNALIPWNTHTHTLPPSQATKQETREPRLPCVRVTGFDDCS